MFLKAIRINNIAEKHTSYYIDANKKYYSQFIVAINKKGEKEVWVNCFCDAFIQEQKPYTINWKKEIVQVEEGGNCFFRLTINLATNSFYDFSVNGFA